MLVFPVFWMISTAFKPDGEINSLTPTWFSLHPTIRHFRDAIDRPYFWQDIENTLIVVGVTVVISIALAFLAAVALAKYRFTGRKLFIVLVIGVQMIPGTGLIIPLYVVLARYHQVNVLSGVIITYLTAALPFSVWTLRGFLIGIPKDLEEAAMVDGSTRLGAFVRILLPLVAPGLVATSVFAFITSWNEYIFARDPPERPGEADDHGLALVLRRLEQADRLGRADGRVDADRDSGRHLLPADPAEDRLRSHRRRRQGLSGVGREPRPAGRSLPPAKLPRARRARVGAALGRAWARWADAVRLQRAATATSCARCPQRCRTCCSRSTRRAAT